MKISRAAVLYGGDSSEREISLLSGTAVHEALLTLGLESSLLDTRERNYLERIKDGRMDLAFIALHGRFGEDGSLQALLEEEGIFYTGSRPEACRRAMDKPLARQCFLRAGLRVPRGFETDSPKDPRCERFGGTLFIKPACGGSSIGVTRLAGRSELEAAFRSAQMEGPRVLVEEEVPGREMTVGILGDEALPILEIRTSRDYFDTRAKYTDPSTVVEEPQDLSPSARERIRRSALLAHRALGCSVFSRIDLIWTKGEPVILEANAIPGLTRKSLLPKMARLSGMGFEELCRRIIEISRSRDEAQVGTKAISSF